MRKLAKQKDSDGNGTGDDTTWMDEDTTEGKKGAGPGQEGGSEVLQGGAPSGSAAAPKIFHVLKKLTPRNERKVRQNDRFRRVLGGLRKVDSGVSGARWVELCGTESKVSVVARLLTSLWISLDGYKIDAAI